MRLREVIGVFAGSTIAGALLFLIGWWARGRFDAWPASYDATRERTRAAAWGGGIASASPPPPPRVHASIPAAPRRKGGVAGQGPPPTRAPAPARGSGPVRPDPTRVVDERVAPADVDDTPVPVVADRAYRDTLRGPVDRPDPSRPSPPYKNDVGR